MKNWDDVERWFLLWYYTYPNGQMLWGVGIPTVIIIILMLVFI